MAKIVLRCMSEVVVEVDRQNADQLTRGAIVEAARLLVENSPMLWSVQGRDGMLDVRLSSEAAISDPVEVCELSDDMPDGVVSVGDWMNF